MNPIQTRLGGVLGEAILANRRGRLSTFVVDATSPAIALFAPARRAHNEEGDWYGEHAGKWLVAAARAAAGSHDIALEARVREVADYLVSVQDADGYLGTYASARRFTQPQPPPPPSWNGEPSVRTWDVWIHAYLVLGLLEAHRLLGDDRHLQAAVRIGELLIRTLDAGIDITVLGNHFGMSATVFMDPACELHFATGEARWLQLARRVLDQADANPRLALMAQAQAGADVSEIGTGKAYQLAWNLVGLAKLHRATGDVAIGSAVAQLWRNIRDRHLTLGGGPWGGVAHRSREVFNAAGAFEPQAYVETCSTLAWIQLNRELLAVTGDAVYADEIERSAYNDLLGAQAADGEDWCYYSFPNGPRVHTTYWRCCKSSGAMALEELPAIACTVDAGGAIAVNLYGPASAVASLPGVGEVHLDQHTAYPHDGAVAIRVRVERPGRFTLKLRIPAWCHDADARIDGRDADTALVPGRYAVLDRDWSGDEVVHLHLPMPACLHRAANRNVQVSRAPDGSAVEQEVLRYDYVAVTRGPLVYATGLVDGYKLDETLRLPPDAAAALRVLPAEAGAAPRVELSPVGRPPLLYAPYYALGDRADGAWRLTWMPLSPLPA